MKKVTFLILALLLVSCNIELNTDFKGAFKYEITNQLDYEKTYLHESFGYIVGDLDILGLNIIGIDDLDKNKDYIVVMNYPILKAYVNSKRIRDESQKHIKLKPVDVVVDKTKKTKHVYIYALDKKDYYRLLVP
ncbi:hypothetical protein [Yeosuana sp.]|uniref:hypothetical protein n=1 Tax=Yeosuana sp. TaxID=2529388 RepID=UPI004054FCC3